MDVQFLGKLIGVEKVKSEKRKKEENSFFVNNAGIEDDFGLVQYIGLFVENPGFKVGDKVYIGKTREELRMAGKDILVMDVSNVIAKVLD